MSDQPTGAPPPDDAFWSASANELLSKLGATVAGLSAVEARSRLLDVGRNVVAEPARRHIGADHPYRVSTRMEDP